MDIPRYRSAFRRKVIPSYYRGNWHIGIFLALEVFALLSTGIWMNWTWWTPLVILFSLTQASILTYFIHRWLLHHKLPGFSWAHKMHHWHHTFYRPTHMVYDNIDDIYMLLMPPWLQLFYFVILIPLGTFLMSHILPLSLIVPYVFGLILWYGMYETVHWIEHLSADHPIMRVSILNWLRRHHSIHHSELRDEANFGIVEPSMDYLFRTNR